MTVSHVIIEVINNELWCWYRSNIASNNQRADRSCIYERDVTAGIAVGNIAVAISRLPLEVLDL